MRERVGFSVSCGMWIENQIIRRSFRNLGAEYANGIQLLKFQFCIFLRHNYKYVFAFVMPCFVFLEQANIWLQLLLLSQTTIQAYSMTINEAQGQIFETVAIFPRACILSWTTLCCFLESTVFSRHSCVHHSSN